MVFSPDPPPPVSLPRAAIASPDATAVADPPLEPPGTRSSPQGLWTGQYPEFSFEEPIANSSQLVLPRKTAPSASSRSTTVALYGGLNPFKIFEPPVESTSLSQRTSLSAISIPASGLTARF